MKRIKVRRSDFLVGVIWIWFTFLINFLVIEHMVEDFGSLSGKLFLFTYANAIPAITLDLWYTYRKHNRGDS